MHITQEYTMKQKLAMLTDIFVDFLVYFFMVLQVNVG